MARFTRAALLALLVAGLTVLGAPAAGAIPAPGTALVRMMHLSPDTPSVDAYIASVSDPDVKVVLKAVSYGDVSGYQTVPAGTYTVSARAAGADPESPPVLGVTVTLDAGTATTIAGVGYFAELGFAVLTDDLTLPPAGQARARVINAASAGSPLDLSLGDASTLARGLDFAKNTEYVDVPGGPGTLSVATSGPDADLPVDLGAGSVYTVLVLNGNGGGVTVQTALDAASPGVVPAGGVETGAGGTAADGANPLPLVALAALAVAALLVTALPRLSRRRRDPRHAAS
ncbi:protein of unknown function [Modestobacter sp. DSM 44400]|uniref:DUF4397 domain-containing protein n=1 Tax=Modestobacter sp. DSM 44400 TaxID=1550230 RepID=UPI000897620B|nr:DUF4397 domain-containing protein [Modestobacter sp. DSM 44400]SDX65811.1 protein of unknown function [Modestobacter sp. DSM 44400]